MLIALAAQEFAQRLNWREQVNEAREALDTQLSQSQYNAMERIAIGECTDRQLDRLDELIEGSSVPEVDLSRVASIRLWGTSSWEAATASGAVSHMTPELRNTYANLFSFTSVLGDANRGEYAALADLRTIKNHRRLTETSRDRLARDLSQLRAYNYLLTLGARQWLESAKPLKLPISEEDTKDLARIPPCRLPDAPVRP